eukprot:10348727-Alexandrium_andersonii.AAC.1
MEQSGVDPNIMQRLADPSNSNVVPHMTAPFEMAGMMRGMVEQMGVDPSIKERIGMDPNITKRTMDPFKPAGM